MSVISIANESATLVLNGFPVGDLAQGDYITMTPINAQSSRVNSGKGGVTISKRLDSGEYDLVFNVQKFSDSDVYFNSAMNQSAITVFDGSLKEAYQKDGRDAVESWVLESGTITTKPTQTKNNVDGNAVVSYTIRVRNAARAL